MKLAAAIILGISITGVQVSAQSVDINWLQQAGISCGGGLGVEVQGEIEAAVIKRLRLGGIEAEGSYDQSDVEKLLSQFASDQKQPVYQDYLTCLLTLMQSATEASGLPAREVELTSNVVVAPLEPVRRGQRFVMEPGDVVAVQDLSQIFTLDKVEAPNNRRKVSFTWSNSETGESKSSWVYQGSPIVIAEQCILVPYKIEPDLIQASFISNC